MLPTTWPMAERSRAPMALTASLGVEMEEMEEMEEGVGVVMEEEEEVVVMAGEVAAAFVVGVAVVVGAGGGDSRKAHSWSGGALGALAP